MQYRCIRDIRAIAACSVYEELTKMMSENPHLCATLRLYASLSVYLRVCLYVYLYVCTHIPTWLLLNWELGEIL